jgi:hypothetical protein
VKANLYNAGLMFETQNIEPQEPSFVQKCAPMLLTAVIGLVVGFLAFGTAIEGDTFYVKFVFPFSFIFIGGCRLVSVADWELSHSYPELAASLALGFILAISIVQFLVYGVVLSLASEKPPMIVKIAGVHAAAVIMAFVLGYVFHF